MNVVIYKKEDSRKRCVYKRINAAEEKEKRRQQKRKLDALKKICQSVFQKRKKSSWKRIFSEIRN